MAVKGVTSIDGTYQSNRKAAVHAAHLVPPLSPAAAVEDPIEINRGVR